MGMEEGRADGLIEVAKNALNKGMNVSLVEELTGLSKNEIEKLAKK